MLYYYDEYFPYIIIMILLYVIIFISKINSLILILLCIVNFLIFGILLNCIVFIGYVIIRVYGGLFCFLRMMKLDGVFIFLRVFIVSYQKILLFFVMIFSFSL